MKWSIPDWLIIVAAAGQIFTALIYPFVRRVVLDWYTDIKKLKPLNHEIARTYGHFIMGLNFSFGIISILFTNDLKNQTALATAFTGLIAVYWTARVVTQFAYYPMHELPNKTVFKIGELLMNSLIILFALVYVLMFINNLSGYLMNV